MKEKTYVDDIDRNIYDFKNDDKDTYKLNAGLTPEIVEKLSKEKNDPAWMQNFRLESLQIYNNMKVPDWGPSIEGLNMDNIVTYVRPNTNMKAKWSEVPEDIKDTFEKLGIPQAERKSLAGVGAQYDSELVYHNVRQEVAEMGVVYTDMESALKGEYADMVRTHFMKLVKPTDHKFAALHGAVWSGGSFIYVPKGVSLDKPLQSYFRINSMSMGQFERTLIIVDEGADVHYVEGCTAPVYSKDSLHAAVVEIFVHKNAKCRYSTVQNWSNNIINLVTKRAKVFENGHMEWIDGNIGSHINMKYPACILAEPYAKGTTVSIAVGSKGQKQDAGSKMIHLAPHTTSTIISKSVARQGGEVNYRGWVKHSKNAQYAKSKVECDTLILDKLSRSDTIPLNFSQNDTSQIEHEATVSNISEEQLFYLMSRGLSRAQATEMIVMGFLEPFTRELPMEYAVELNQMLKLDMSDSIG